MGIGVPQYLCLEISHSLSLKLIAPLPRPLLSIHLVTFSTPVRESVPLNSPELPYDLRLHKRRPRRCAFTMNDFYNFSPELFRKIPVSLVVSRNSHYRPCPVIGQNVICNKNRYLFAAGRVYSIYAFKLKACFFLFSDVLSIVDFFLLCDI